MPLSSDQRRENLEASRQIAITNIAVLLVTIEKPKKGVTAEEVLIEAEQLYDSYFDS
jgi:hypothetical protein